MFTMLHVPYFFFFISHGNVRELLEFTEGAERKSIFVDHLTRFYWML